MIHRLYNFFISQKYFSILSIIFAVYGGVFLLHYFIDNSFVALLQLIGGLFFMVLGTGLSVTLILQWLLKRTFDRWEFLTISLLGGLLIFPLILLVEFLALGKVYSWYPLANGVLLWFSAGVLLFYKKISFPNLLPAKLTLKNPLFVILLLGIIFTTVQVSLYDALPDLDPYTWLYKYTYQFENQLLDYTERPLFGSLAYIGTQLMGVNVFDFFKYVFPYLFLLALFPAWMVARTFESATKRWIFLLFVFTSPTVILYAQTPMPQALLIILSFYSVFLLFYASQKKDNLFLYLAGVILLLAFLYHQAAVIIFIVWLISMIIAKRDKIFAYKKISLLIFLLIATNLSRFENMYDFALSWITVVIASIFREDNLNLLYPARYVNVDRNMMGWDSATGVVKFYAFHMGPLLGSILLVFLVFLFFNSNFRSFLINIIKKNVSLGIVLFTFLIFFMIAEILPRFPNIALLPDRAWIFSGIFAFVFLFIILRYIKSLPMWTMSAFVILLIISISGALYINYLKRYLIAPEQWRSAEWIQSNLPDNRIFLSYGHKNLLPVHANTPLLRIPSYVYCSDDIQEFQKSIGGNKTKKDLRDSYYTAYLENIEPILSEALIYSNDDTLTIKQKYEDTLKSIDIILQETDSVRNTLKKDIKTPILYPLSKIPVVLSPVSYENAYNQIKVDLDDVFEENNLYVYYARQNIRNPYRTRPYSLQTWGIDPCPDGKFLFDRFPDSFKRVYSTNNDKVIIWRVL